VLDGVGLRLVVQNPELRRLMKPEGGHFVVLLNGRQTVGAQNAKLSAGTIGLQGCGSGLLRFLNIEIRTLARGAPRL
jgi:hypothetical protein